MQCAMHLHHAECAELGGERGALPLGTAATATWFHAEARRRGELPQGEQRVAGPSSPGRDASIGPRLLSIHNIKVFGIIKVFDVAGPRSVRL